MCAWCGGRTALLEWGADVCERGCAAAEHAPYLGHCEDCGDEYATGNPQRRHQCERCFRAEMMLPDEGIGQSHTGFTYRMRRDAANRHAMALLNEVEREAAAEVHRKALAQSYGLEDD